MVAVATRITSLDWARGWLILINLVAIAFLYPAWDQLQHPAWLGVTLFDLIFPTFVTLSGCGMAFAYAKGFNLGVTVRRCAVLLAVGLSYNAVLADTWNLSQLRWFGPLQVYAVLVVVVALLHISVRGVRAWAATTVVVALTWTVITWTFNLQCPTGAPTRSCNLSAAVDLRLFPAEHLYRQGTLGHDPEGLAAIVGALITMLVGVTAGKILLAGRSTPPTVTVARLVAWLVVVAALGAMAAMVVEPFKRVWSPSFALLASTVGLGLLIVGYVLHDRPVSPWRQTRRNALAQPVVALGRNALVLYFGAHLLLHQVYVRADPTIADRISSTSMPWGGDARSLFAVAFVLGFLALAVWLHRRRIYIHA